MKYRTNRGTSLRSVQFRRLFFFAVIVNKITVNEKSHSMRIIGSVSKPRSDHTFNLQTTSS